MWLSRYKIFIIGIGFVKQFLTRLTNYAVVLNWQGLWGNNMKYQVNGLKIKFDFVQLKERNLFV